jgi:hypothetical protein
MKNIYKILIPAFSLVLIFTLMSFSGCKKEKIPPLSSNITLYDKDTTTIQNYIQGKWRVVYMEINGTGLRIHYFDNAFVEITNKNITSSDDVVPFGSTEYYWTSYESLYSDVDNIYVASLLPPTQYNTVLVFEKIYNDTLVYYDYDVRNIYHCVKFNN